MNGRDDIEMLAAEYVLGTLDDAERTAVAARRLNEPDLDAAIGAWERRLAPLDATAGDAAVEPSPDLFDRITARLDANEPGKTAGTAVAATVIRLETRLRRWRVAALAASLVAVVFAGALFLRQTPTAPNRQTFVAVLNQGDSKPAFLLSVDLQTRQLTIRPVAAEQHADRSYELWIVSAEFGPAPKSLGILDGVGAPTHRPLPELTPAVLRQATFGISLEPKGGSPVGKPTGPTMLGQLIPADT